MGRGGEGRGRRVFFLLVHMNIPLEIGREKNIDARITVLCQAGFFPVPSNGVRVCVMVIDDITS
jgi:hypothetical protein